MRAWIFIPALLLAACGAEMGNGEQTLQVVAECNAAATNCEARGAGRTMTFSMAGARTMQPTAASLRWDGPVAESVLVSFNMVGMDMGDNRYRLLPDGQGAWSGKVLLPVCVRGRSDWVADVTLKDREGASYRARFILNVGP